MYLHIGAVLSVILGLMACFAGYRLFRLVLVVVGFLGGATLAAGLFWAFLPQQPALFGILVGIVGGIIGAVLLGFFYFAGVFVVGAGLGVLLATILSLNLNWERVLAAIILGVLGGVLALALQKLLIIVATAFLGSWAVLAGEVLFLGWSVPLDLIRQPPVFWNSTWGTAYLIAWLVLGGFGVAVQYQPAHRSPEPSPPERSR